MISSGTLTPAYGRDYKSAKEVKADFVAGKDFVLNTFQGSTYCSIVDCLPGATLVFRFGGNRKVTSIKVPKV